MAAIPRGVSESIVGHTAQPRPIRIDFGRHTVASVCVGRQITKITGILAAVKIRSVKINPVKINPYTSAPAAGTDLSRPQRQLGYILSIWPSQRRKRLHHALRTHFHGGPGCFQCFNVPLSSRKGASHYTTKGTHIHL